VVVVAVILGAMGAASPGAAGSPVSASITMSATSGGPGTRLVITTQGFGSKEKVQPYWDYGAAASTAENSFYFFNPIATTDSSGSGITDFFIPQVPDGTYPVAVKGLRTGTVVQASFTVVPRLDIGSYLAPAGTPLRIQACGFAAGEVVKVTFGSSPQSIVSATTGADGCFGVRPRTTSSSLAPGPYAVTATGGTSHLAVSDTFTVGSLPSGPPPGPDDWSQFGYSLQGDRINPSDTAISTTNASSLAPKWIQTMPGRDRIASSPTVADGIVYVGTTHGLVEAYNASTGAPVWSRQVEGSVYGAPSIANGIAYFGTVATIQGAAIGDWAYAVNAATGALIWEVSLPYGSEWQSPLVTGGRVVFAESDREAAYGGELAVDALTGATDWSTNTGYGIWSPTTVDPTGAVLFQGTGNACLTDDPEPSDGCSGRVEAINAATGAVVWSYLVPDLSGDDDVPTAPVYDSGVVYSGSKDGMFFAIDATDGTVLWSYDTGSRGDSGVFSTAVATGQVLYWGGGDGNLRALNQSNGAAVWLRTIGPPLIASPAMANGVLFVGDLAGVVHAIDPATGNDLWTAPLAGAAYGSPTIADGTLYQAGEGTLEAFTPGGV